LPYFFLDEKVTKSQDKKPSEASSSIPLKINKKELINAYDTIVQCFSLVARIFVECSIRVLCFKGHSYLTFYQLKLDRYANVISITSTVLTDSLFYSPQPHLRG
jgi:hypothetical protein